MKRIMSLDANYPLLKEIQGRMNAALGRMPASVAAEIEGPHITKMRAILADVFSGTELVTAVNSLTAGEVLQLAMADFIGKEKFANPKFQTAKEKLTAVYESFRKGVQARFSGTKIGAIASDVADAYKDSVKQHSAARDFLVTGGKPGGPTRKFTTFVPPTKRIVPRN